MFRLTRNLTRNVSKPLHRSLSHVPIEDSLFGLDDDAIEIRYTYRKFFEKELPEDLLRKYVLVKKVKINQFFGRIDTNDDFPDFRNFMKKCGDMGILGPGVEEEYGGAGEIPLMSACMVGEELSRTSAALSMGVGHGL